MLASLTFLFLIGELFDLHWRSTLGEFVGVWGHTVRPVTKWVLDHTFILLCNTVFHWNISVPMPVRDYLSVGLILEISWFLAGAVMVIGIEPSNRTSRLGDMLRGALNLLPAFLYFPLVYVLAGILTLLFFVLYALFWPYHVVTLVRGAIRFGLDARRGEKWQALVQKREHEGAELPDGVPIMKLFMPKLIDRRRRDRRAAIKAVLPVFYFLLLLAINYTILR